MDIKRIKDASYKLFGDQLWELNTEGLSGIRRRIVRFIKLIRITFNTFAEQRMGFQCVALSYFSALAIVPFAAFIFAVGGGLGVDDKLSELAHNILPSNPEFIDTVLDKAGNIVHIAQSGIVGVIGALAFLWTIIWLFFQVERVFNNVWGIRKIPRKLYKRFGFYFLVLLLTPFIAIIFSAGIAYYSNFSKFLGLDLSELRFLPKLLGYLGFYVIATLTLSAMYKFIPATEVKYRNAIRAAAIGGAVFVIFQYLYLETQVFVARLNTVYGVLAAIPLFLIWLNFSWQIIIYGAELTYSFQNIKNYGLQEEVGKK